VTEEERLLEDDLVRHIEGMKAELDFAWEHGCEPANAAIQAHGDQAIAAIHEMCALHRRDN
jgi:hypothetical protein